MVRVIFWNLRYIARDFFDLGTNVFVPNKVLENMTSWRSTRKKIKVFIDMSYNLVGK